LKVHSIKIAQVTDRLKFAFDLPAISSDIRDVFSQNQVVALNKRQSVFTTNAGAFSASWYGSMD
jgi:hypothetical protein